MKNRFLLLVMCIVMALCVAMAASFVVSAETESADTDSSSEAQTDQESSEPADSSTDTEGEGDDEGALFTLEFLNGDIEPVVMTVENNVCTCTVTLKGGTAYPFVIKNAGSILDARQYLLYKQADGTATFSYSLADKATVKGGEGDVYDTFAYSETMFSITLTGATFTGLPGNFDGKSVSAFFFKGGDDVAVSAVVEEGMRFKEWKTNDTSIRLGEKETASFTVSNKSSKKITIEAVVEPTLEKLLSENKTVKLEADYTVEKTIKLTEGDYVINLGGHKIESQGTVFEVNGATLKLEGEGEITSAGATSSPIDVKKGTLEILGGKYTGGYSAIYAGGDTETLGGSSVQVSIKGGEFKSGSMAALNFINCEATITGGTFVGELTENSSCLVGAQGGSVTINGGKFDAAKSVYSWNATKDNIKIYSGDFSDDVTEYVVAGSAVKSENGRFIVAADSNLYQLEVLGGKGTGLYKVGETVTVTLDKTGKNTPFIGWVVVSGELTLEDTLAESFSFRMPAGNLQLEAKFEEAATTSPDTAPTTKPAVTSPIGNVGNDTTSNTGDGDGKRSIWPIILIIILVALIVAILAVLVIMLIRKKNAEIEEQERAQLSADVMDSLADKLAGLGLGVAAGAGAAKAQNDAARPRPVRRRPTANFEPEDLTVTAVNPAVADDPSATKVQPIATGAEAAATPVAADDPAATREMEIPPRDRR